MPKSITIDYRHLLTVPAILRIVALIFNILAIIFANLAENPYYAVNSVIKFNSIAIAGAFFSIITLAIALVCIELRDSLKWLRNELLIELCIIIVYVYGCVTMVRETLDCSKTLGNSCPRQLTATVAGIAATVTYSIDGVWKLRELRRKLRAERIAAGNDDAKVDEPYVDEVQQSPTTETEPITTNDEPPTPTAD